MSLTHARELAVLSIVIAHPVHGYEIASAFERGPLRLLGLKRSAVYSILARFVARGWIEERDEPGGSYPDRKVNHATQAGRAAADTLLETPGGLSQTPLMALTMLHDVGMDVRAALEAQLAQRVAFRDELARADDTHRHGLSHRLAEATLDAEIDIITEGLNKPA